jgi:hypothetical protein
VALAPAVGGGVVPPPVVAVGAGVVPPPLVAVGADVGPPGVLVAPGTGVGLSPPLELEVAVVVGEGLAA